MNHPPLPQVADHLRHIAKLLDQSAGHNPTRARTSLCRCLPCRARLLGSDSIGFPAGTLGTGIRTSDPTSTTEQAALNPDPYALIDYELAAALGALFTSGLTALTIIDRINTRAPDDDPLPAGTGPCRIPTCETVCRPDGKHPDNRLRSGLCPACWVSWNKHKTRNPAASLIEWRPIRTAALRPKPVTI